MLSDLPCATMIPASDLERAKRWYSEKLGLEPSSDDPGGVEYRCGDGTMFSVYPSQFAGTGQQTVMGWLTPDLEVEMKELKSRGVTFEEYDLPGVKTVDGVAEIAPGEKGAWFKDSEGNILSIFQSAARAG